MTNWPDKPLIRIIRGREYDEPVRGALATRLAEDEYLLATGPRAENSILRKVPSDQIDEWEEITAVPTAALEELRKAWHGDGEYTPKGLKTLGDAMDPVLSCLPADKPSALDRAVTDTKNIGARGILEDFPLNDRISLLLAAVRDTHTGEDLRYRLAWVVRLAYTWADLEDPSRDALEGIRNRAATEVGRCGGDLATLARQAGDVAGSTSEGRSPRSALIALGSRALAWAAQTIEEEDK